MEVKNVSVKNCGMLKDLRLDDFKALNVFIGPNASGKSTTLQVLDTLLEAGSLTLSPDLPFRASAADPVQLNCGIRFGGGEIEEVLRNFARSNRRRAPEASIINEIERAFAATEFQYQFDGIAP